RPVLRVDDHVGERQRRAGYELFQLALVRRTVGRQVGGVELAVAPVADEQRLLVLRRELGPVAEADAGGRTGANLDGRRQVVGVVRRPLAGAVAPAVLAAAGDVADAGRPVPRRVQVPFHVGVVG